MHVFITGISGFIAGHLRLFLQAQGWTISGSSSRMVVSSEKQAEGDPKIFSYSLGGSIETRMFEGIEVVIHCAHDFQKNALKKNIEGTIALAETAAGQGVEKQIFISSLSSRPDAESEYGKAKFEIEHYFKKGKGIILRPGTVLGRGGIFGKMIHLMETLPIVPLLDGGTSQLYVIGMEDLCRSIFRVIQDPGENKEYSLYYPEKVTLKELLRALKRMSGRRTLLIPIPATFMILPLSVIQTLGIKLPVDIENLRGFIKSQTMIYPSDLGKLLSQPMSLEESLRAIF